MRTKLLVLVLVVAGAAWMLWPTSQAQRSHSRLINRVWIERLPNAPTEKFDIFLMLGDENMGAFQHTSLYEGDYSLFSWDTLASNHVDLVMLQTGRRHRMSFDISSKDCGGFDYCMKVKGAPRGTRHYYSMEDWVIESGPGAVVMAPAELGRVVTSAMSSADKP